MPGFSTGATSRFPDASDFSPGIIGSVGSTELRRLLAIIADGAGDRAAIVEGIRDAFFSTRASSQQLKSAANPLIALNENNYRLLEPGRLELNDIGASIRSAPTEAEALALFARHIVRELPGPDLLRAIRSLQARGERPNKTNLAFELGLLGYALTPTHTDQTRMASWLREAGVLRGWIIDEPQLLAVTGVSLSDIEEWADLEEPQRAFLRSLRRFTVVHGGAPVPVETIIDDVEALHGHTIWKRSDHIPQDVIYPLAAGDWLEAPTHSGRGARRGDTRGQPRLLAVDIDVVDRQLLSGLHVAVRRDLRRPIADIIGDLDDPNPEIAGRALETLAARIAIELGLTALRPRDRNEVTGGMEVDLVGEMVGRTYARWVIQCKNTTGKAAPEVLSREVGVALVAHATVVVLVSRGGFSTRLEALAAQVTQRTNLQVLLIDGDDLTSYATQGVRAIVRSIRRQTAVTADAKRL